jgi:hypothetical protein
MEKGEKKADGFPSAAPAGIFFRYVLVASALVLMYVSCMTSTVGVDTDMGDADDLGPLVIEPVYDLAFFREEIERHVARVKTGQAAVGSGPEEVQIIDTYEKKEMPDDMLAVHFGNGLCIDAMGNIYLDIRKILGVKYGSSYELSADKVAEKSTGQTIIVEQKSLFGWSTRSYRLESAGEERIRIERPRKRGDALPAVILGKNRYTSYSRNSLNTLLGQSSLAF